MKSPHFVKLRQLSHELGVLPSSYHLSESELTDLADSLPDSSGGFADIRTGQLHGVQVCVK